MEDGALPNPCEIKIKPYWRLPSPEVKLLKRQPEGR
jgi:hypothetical protein